MADGTARDPLSRWLRGRAPEWRRLERILSESSERRVGSPAHLMALVQGLRALARDLSLARAVLPGSPLTLGLEALYLRAHEVVYRPPRDLVGGLAGMLGNELPAVLWDMRRTLTAAAGLFLGSIAVGWWLVWRYPELAGLFASQAMIETLGEGRLWTEGLLNLVPSSLLSLGIMTNNIVVTLFAFGLGVFYGFGTLYILGVNGLMLGGVFALTRGYGLDGALLAFILPHGPVELSVVVLAAAAGLGLGEALIRPGRKTRAAAFRIAVGRAGCLLAVGLVFLVGAGLIEGYISPDPRFGLGERVGIGLTYWLLLVLVLSGRLSPARWVRGPAMSPGGADRAFGTAERHCEIVPPHAAGTGAGRVAASTGGRAAFGG